jgi:hypothetical protein
VAAPVGRDHAQPHLTAAQRAEADAFGVAMLNVMLDLDRIVVHDLTSLCAALRREPAYQRLAD